MRKYLVNSTYCIYLTDINALYFDESISTIKEVVEEVAHERGIFIDAPTVSVRKANIVIKNNLLSSTDSMLLQTAKVIDSILVTDDQKLIAAAHQNGVHRLDTPHFIHRLLIENKLSKEKALAVLNQLKSLYNRKYVVDKVIKDIQNWR